MFGIRCVSRYLTVVALFLSLLGAGTPAMAAPPGVVVADGLANPRGIAITDDGTLYVAEAGPGGNLYVADAGANDLLRVNPHTGQTGVVTTFAGIPRPTANPARGGKSENDPVPSNVVVGPDGNLYVGLLTGFPTVTGGANVLRVTPGGAVSDAVTGLTSVSWITFGPDNL